MQMHIALSKKRCEFLCAHAVRTENVPSNAFPTLFFAMGALSGLWLVPGLVRIVNTVGNNTRTIRELGPTIHKIQYHKNKIKW